jgi:hypothetical protein
MNKQEGSKSEEIINTVEQSEGEIDTSYSSKSEIPVRRPIDKERNRYPYCIVWTPLPVISWLLPIIGHTGICGYNNTK